MAATTKSKKSPQPKKAAKVGLIAKIVWHVHNIFKFFGKAIKRANGVTLIDSKRSVPFVITDNDIRMASACKENNCVVAMALTRVFGDSATAFSVGYYITKVIDERTKTVLRFQTPSMLRNAIKKYDLSAELNNGKGQWHFDVKVGHLLPIPASYKHYERGNRWDKMKKNKKKGTQSVHRAIVETRPRIVRNVQSIYKSMIEGLPVFACPVTDNKIDKAFAELLNAE
jgi:hypothetical protein